MKLAQLTLTDFSGVLASNAPAPGGGSTAALQGALGAALTHMIAALTVDKAKYKQHSVLMQDILEKSEILQRQFLDVMDRDTEAFDGVSAVFALPKDTDEQKTARKQAMQTALKACTRTPFEMMELSLAALELAHSAAGKSNASAASDLGVAALSLKAAVQGAWLNVLINIDGMEDQSFAQEFRAKGEAILHKALPLADEVYAGVLAAVGG